MPDYTTYDPKGWGGDPSRGAALGRPSVHDDEPEGPITVRETVLDSGGYDRNGTYFGIGPALYWYADEGGNVDDVFRFSPSLDGWEENTREAADAVVRAKYPNATIIIAEPIRPRCMGLGDEETCPGGADICDYSDEFCEMCDCIAYETCARCGREGREAGRLESADGDGEGGLCPSCRDEETDDE